MKKYFSLATISCTLLTAIIACAKQDKISSVQLPFNGKYEWKFSIPGHGNQVSYHTFNNALIDYEMKGDVYNIKYGMIVLSYDAPAQKCITEVKDNSSKKGKFFTLFFKDIATTSVIIYKVETENLEQAKAYKRPADNDTNNHGWNKYTKQ